MGLFSFLSSKREISAKDGSYAVRAKDLRNPPAKVTQACAEDPRFQEAVSNAARNLVRNGDGKAVAIIALDADGNCYTGSSVRGEGYYGEGVDTWRNHLASYVEYSANDFRPRR